MSGVRRPSIDLGLDVVIDIDEEADISPSSWPMLIEAITALSERLQEAKEANRKLTAELLVSIFSPFEKIVRKISNNEASSSADFWTNSQAVIELLSSVDKIIWIASLIDDIATPTNISPIAGFSWWGVGIGSFLALILAAAELYCHKIINIVNQTNDSNIFNPAVFNETPVNSTVLTWKQKIALSFETISHIGDIGSKFAVYSRIFNVQPTLLKILLHGTGGVFGMIGSVAETRTHLNSMLRFNSMSSRQSVEEALHQPAQDPTSPSSRNSETSVSSNSHTPSNNRHHRPEISLTSIRRSRSISPLRENNLFRIEDLRMQQEKKYPFDYALEEHKGDYNLMEEEKGQRNSR